MQNTWNLHFYVCPWAQFISQDWCLDASNARALSYHMQNTLETLNFICGLGLNLVIKTECQWRDHYVYETPSLMQNTWNLNIFMCGLAAQFIIKTGDSRSNFEL